MAEVDTLTDSGPGQDPAVELSRGLARQAAILDAAIELVAEVGYDRLTMDALAARARASKATIYRRWPGKAEVVVEALRRRACPTGVCPPAGADVRQDLLALLGRMRDTLLGFDGRLVLGLLLAARSDPDLAAIVRDQVMEDKRRAADEVVARAVARRELPASADPRVIDEIASAALLMRMLFTGEALDQTFLVHLVDDIVLPLLRRATDAPA